MMSSNKLEAEAESDCSTTSESLSMSNESSSASCYPDNRGKAEPRRKIKKLRSIRLVRLPSSKATIKQAKIQSDLFSDAASSYQSSPLRMSPNYMKTTTSSDAKKESLQKSTRTLARRSSFRPGRSLTRLSSKKFRRSLMKKSSGGADMKSKLKKSRSIKVAKQSSIVLSSESRNVDFQASSCNSDSSWSSNDDSELNLMSSGNKSARVKIRISNLRPVRIFKKMASLRTNRSSMNSSSPIIDSNIHRATCSSAIKHSKLPDHLELQPGKVESERVLAAKVCPYSYCSLHGHHNSAVPPLKRVVSMRRRLLKTQKSMKSEVRLSHKAKTKSTIHTSQMTHNGHHQHPEANANKAKADLKGDIILGEDGRDISNSIISVDNSEKADLRLPAIKVAKLCNKQPSDDTITICQEDIPANAKFHQGVTEDGPSHLTIDMAENDSDSNTLQTNMTIGASSDIVDIESGLVNNMVSAASVSKPKEEIAACELKKEDSADEVGCIIDKAYNTQMENQKNVGLWSLIYRHMVSGIAADSENNLPHDNEDKQKQEEDAYTLCGMKKSGSHTDQSMEADDQDGGKQKIQIYQNDAIKLVKEAFEKILAEIPDPSLDDQSITSDKTTDQDLAKKNHEGEELCIVSSDSSADSKIQDPEEMRHVSKGETAKLNLESKSNPKAPKGWNNLKKIIILNRFVKAFEKVRNFNPRKPRYLPKEDDPEAEKVNLRHQSMEERKNPEEWMLDHALQQVISTLAPAQKRKVALLVQAFETVVPLPEIGTPLKYKVAASPHATHIETRTMFLDGNSFGEGRGTLSPEMSMEDKVDQASDFCTAEQHIQLSCSEFGETNLECGSVQTTVDAAASETTTTESHEKVAALDLYNNNNNFLLEDGLPNSVDNCLVEIPEPKLCDETSPKPVAVVRTCEEFLQNEGSTQKFNKEVGSVSSTKVQGQINANGDQLDEPKNEIQREYEESNADNNVFSSDSASELLVASSKAYEETTESEPSYNPASNNGKQTYTRLWYLIYKHMVTGNAAPFEGADKEEQGDDSSKSIGTDNNDSHQDFSSTNQDLNMKDHDASSPRMHLQQIEAIRLVEAAIDEIPLPESHDDSPDNQSGSSDTIPDEDHQQKKPSDRGEVATSTQQTTTLEPDKPSHNSENTGVQEEAKSVSKAGDRPKLTPQKSWSNLKKVILLNRFVKALEKVKRFNPRDPRFLPFNSGKEAEKIHLRRQDVEDRKNADEWMLDYALQQAVAKLTPIRKRKVQLLVEAFETVVPTVGN